MVDKTEPLTFNPDAPLGNPDDDRLGHRVFAKSLSNAVLKMIPKDGLVIAVNGKQTSQSNQVVDHSSDNKSTPTPDVSRHARNEVNKGYTTNNLPP